MKRKRVVCGVLLSFAILVGLSLIALESQEPLGWRRFKRHVRLAIAWRSPDQVKEAFTPPKDRRIAAIVPFRGAPVLWLSAPDWGKRTVSYPNPVVRQVGRGDYELEKPGGDIEWVVHLPPGDYTAFIGGSGALIKRLFVTWDPSNDLDLGRIDLVYGDLNGDDAITQADLDTASKFVGKPATPWGGVNYADLNRNGVIETWEVDVVRSNMGKVGESKLGRESEPVRRGPLLQTQR